MVSAIPNLQDSDNSTFSQVEIIFSDLDGTFFPGAYETEYNQCDYQNLTQLVAESESLSDSESQTVLQQKIPSWTQDPRAGFRLNLIYADLLLQEFGIATIPTTGNSPPIAQIKYSESESQKTLKDLSKERGIYCNGALVRVEGGKEILCKSIGDVMEKNNKLDQVQLTNQNFLQAFTDHWMQAVNTQSSDSKNFDSDGWEVVRQTAVCGLGKNYNLVLDVTTALSADQKQNDDFGTSAITLFLSHLKIPNIPPITQYFSPKEFRETGQEILSLLLLFPKNASLDLRLKAQKWLQKNELLHFYDTNSVNNVADSESDKLNDSEFRLCAGHPSHRFDAVSKHVQVPGIGPEMDISPLGINKGTAIIAFLDYQKKKDNFKNLQNLEGSKIAVFGDAANDIELFGWKKKKEEDSESPQDPAYRPDTRVAMPWTNDETLRADATHIAKVHEVMERILLAKRKVRCKNSDLNPDLSQIDSGTN